MLFQLGMGLRNDDSEITSERRLSPTSCAGSASSDFGEAPLREAAAAPASNSPTTSGQERPSTLRADATPFVPRTVFNPIVEPFDPQSFPLHYSGWHDIALALWGRRQGVPPPLGPTPTGPLPLLTRYSFTRLPRGTILVVSQPIPEGCNGPRFSINVGKHLRILRSNGMGAVAVQRLNTETRSLFTPETLEWLSAHVVTNMTREAAEQPDADLTADRPFSEEPFTSPRYVI